MMSKQLAPVALASAVLMVSVSSCNRRPAASTSAPNGIGARIDNLFAEWNRSDSPGCGLGVSRNGALIYHRGYGMASLEFGVPITAASVFPAASISKQFTAMSILLLAQRGKLSLDDEVQKFVPEWGDHGGRITIRHLLTHTSGLRDAFLLEGLAPPREDLDRNEEIVQILVRARGLNFLPGSEFQYNNGGYTLLGSIVKRASGQSLRTFAEANIFKPLGMTHTHFNDDRAMLVPNRVSGYHHDASGFHPASETGGIVGNGGLETTVEDLLRWEQNFAEPRVGGAALLDAMQTPAIPTGWSESNSYGFGVEIAKYRGLRTVSHGGGDRGVAAYVVRYPEQNFAVALLCNLDNIGETGGVTGLTQRVADIYLADRFTAPAPAAALAARLPLSPAQLADKAGLYLDPASGSIGRILVRDGKLMASSNISGDPAIELTPVTPTRFVIPGTAVTADFVAASPGHPQEVRVTGVAAKPVVSQKLPEPPALSAAQLRAFEGDYTSPEVAGTYTIVANQAALIMKILGRSDIALHPISPDAFAAEILGLLKFQRTNNAITAAFTATSDGARNLPFTRTTHPCNCR